MILEQFSHKLLSSITAQQQKERMTGLNVDLK